MHGVFHWAIRAAGWIRQGRRISQMLEIELQKQQFLLECHSHNCRTRIPEHQWHAKTVSPAKGAVNRWSVKLEIPKQKVLTAWARKKAIHPWINLLYSSKQLAIVWKVIEVTQSLTHPTLPTRRDGSTAIAARGCDIHLGWMVVNSDEMIQDNFKVWAN